MATIDYCSWEDVNRLSRQLVAKIDEPFDAIVCLIRGVAIPGVILANKLNINRVCSQVKAVLPYSAPILDIKFHTGHCKCSPLS